MITSKLKVQEQPEQETKFPCIMRSKMNGLVILFAKERVGIVINVGDSQDSYIGEFCNFWRMDNFVEVTGIKVVLEQ